MDDRELVGVVAALGSAAISAVAMLLVRNLVHTEKIGDHRAVVLADGQRHGAAFHSVRLAGADAGAGGAADLRSAFCGGVAQILMTEAYRHAEASTVAPFEYTSMILGIVVGYLAFGDVPTIHMLVGGAIVIGAGIFIVWREQQLGIERARAQGGGAAAIVLRRLPSRAIAGLAPSSPSAHVMPQLSSPG